VFRRKAKAASGIVWLEDVIQFIALSSVDISMNLGKASSETAQQLVSFVECILVCRYGLRCG